jgi:diguanylate cyclase (GGDEF)-like protein/PAS domain S-box-containing protein
MAIMDALLKPSFALIGGGLLGLLLLGVSLWWVVRRRARRLTQRMTITIADSEIRLQEISAALGEGVYVQDSAGLITFVNLEAQRLLGWSAEELLGRDAHRLLHYHTQVTVFPGGICPLHKALREGRRFRAEDDALRRKDGTPLAVAVVATPIVRQGQPVGAVVAFRDLTERKRTEQVLRTNQRFQSLFEYSREALFLLAADGSIVEVNRLACDSLGCPRKALLGRVPDDCFRELTVAGQPVTLSQILEQVAYGQSVVMEGELLPARGGPVPIEALCSPIHDGGDRLVLMAARDVTRRKRAELNLQQAKVEAERANQQLIEMNQALQRLSQLDGLTGIANRRYFDEYLLREWRRAARNGYGLGLIMADVDYFKRYNDHYGHQSGDTCLRTIAGALGAEIHRPADLLVRYGGEELAVVLPDTLLEGALHLAEQMRMAVEALAIPHVLSSVARHVTLSLGVAVVKPTPLTEPQLLIRATDRALYRAKAQGRNRVCAADDQAGEPA